MDTPHQSRSWSKKLGTRRLPISSHVLPSLFVVQDSIAILASAVVLYVIVVGDQPLTTAYYAVATIFVWLITLMLMNFAGLYLFDSLQQPLTFAHKIIGAFVVTFLFLLAAAFSLKVSATFSRVWIVAFAVASCSVTILLRVLASFALRRLSNLRVFTRGVVIAGGGKQLGELLEFIEHSKPPFISVLGVFVDEPKGLQKPFTRLGRLDEVVAYARKRPVDDVVLALPWSADERVIDLLNRLRELALNVHLGTDLIGYRVNFRDAPSHFGDVPIFQISDNPLPGWNGMIKRLEDYGLGIAAAVVFLPLMLMIAIAVKLESTGPVIYHQDRIGFLNKVFRIYKFRTMRWEPLAATTVQAARNDPRVTRVGRFLRRTSLDELPNLINVLNGTMSLVGPRPHAVDHNHTFSKTVTDYFVRHRIKPGMTGWAQVNGLRGVTDTPDKIESRVRYDIYYAENWSPSLDVKILFMTLVICLTGRNAY